MGATITMRNKMRALCAILFALATLPALPQTTEPQGFALAEPYFVAVGDKEAIPFGMVTAQTQDARGLLWLGTQNGLVRYDGYRFRKFAHVHGDPRSLAGDFINCLWADADGKIWVGTAGTGLSVFDPATEQFINFHHEDGKPGSIGADEVQDIVGDGKGGHWIATSGGLDYQAAHAAGFTHFRHAEGDAGSVADDNIRSLLRDRNGQLWLGENTGLQRLAADGRHFERIASEAGQAASLAGKKVRSMFEAADGKIWLGTGSNGIAWLDPHDGVLHWPDETSADAGHGAIKAIAQPHPDQIWLATFGDGMVIVSAADGHLLRRLRHDPADDHSLGLDILGSLKQDRNGDLWVGTWGGGLQRYGARNKAFRMLRHSQDPASVLSHQDIHSVLQLQDGRIAVGTGGNGIDIIDLDHGPAAGYRPPKGKERKPEDLTDGVILALAQAPDGTLWAGTQRKGILRLQPGAKAWESFFFGGELKDNAVNALLVSRSGEVYAATDNGFWRWRPGNSEFANLKDLSGKPILAPTYPLTEDRQGRIWGGSLHGLFVLEPGADGMAVFHPDARNENNISTDIIGGLLVDHEGALWVATAEGLERLASWNGKTPQFEHISTLAGQAGQNFGSNLLEDKQGRIWSEDHIYDPHQKSITALSGADGLDFGISWVGSYTRLKSGLFLQGGTEGLAIIAPDQFHASSDEPPMVASELKINGIAQPYSLQPALVLQPNQRNFSIEFSVLDYLDPARNQYRYRLTGYDDTWIDTDAGHRIASYGNLWPGNYTLEAMGSNRTGAWSPHTLSIPITVLPAFWQTPWFLLLALLATGALILAGFRWRLARHKANAAALQSLVDERTHELMEKNRELELLAATDRLTGLYNRLKLDQILEAEVARSQRYGNAFSLILIDLDKFKEVNDRHGHQVGDKVLATLADILATNTRDVDAVGRWGGEEFLIIASNTALSGAHDVAEKLRLKIANHAFPVVERRTASFGITTFRTGDSAGEMLARADAALYQAKEGGRNRVEAAA